MNKDAKWLAWLEEQFSRVSGESRQISLHDFTNVLGVKEVRKSFLRFFHLYHILQFNVSEILLILIFFSCFLRSSSLSCLTKTSQGQLVCLS